MQHQDSFQPVKEIDGISNDSDHERATPQNGHRLLHHCTPIPILSVVIYLLLWVANAEMMQGVASGTLAPEAFDRPAFLSWFSYNFMLLSWIPVAWYCRKVLGCTVDEYLRLSWAGPSGFAYMLASSLFMQMLLLALNMLWIFGLGHISVTVSNAVYQLQAAVTVALSVWCLGSRFTEAEGVGILISLVGVFLIVIPPLVDEPSDDADSNANYVFLGMFATLLSAVIWAIYQIAWRVIAKDKPEMTRIDGLMDTVATLGVMGLCNICLGWPVLLVVHLMGVERFEFPSWNLIPSLTRNGLIEYAFDNSLAIAIYLTSPVVTAMTAPLTIPIALVWDHFLHGSPFQVGNYDWFGSFLVLVGVVWMELKISLSCFARKNPQTENTYDAMPDAGFVYV